MPFVVVDTCVVSYLYNNHSLAEKYRPALEGSIATISFMTLGELHYGALKRNWSQLRHDQLIDHVRHEYVVVPFNHALCWQWAVVRDRTRRLGRQIKVGDSWIAATALLYESPLVTHNRKHFEVLEPDLAVISES